MIVNRCLSDKGLNFKWVNWETHLMHTQILHCNIYFFLSFCLTTLQNVHVHIPYWTGCSHGLWIVPSSGIPHGIFFIYILLNKVGENIEWEFVVGPAARTNTVHCKHVCLTT